MSCNQHTDANGTSYFIEEDKTGRDPSGRVLKGVPELQVWWARQFKSRRDETLIIKQDNNPDKSDVIELTLGQVYDLIHALGWAVMRK